MAFRGRPSKLIDVVHVVVNKFDESIRKDLDRDIIVKTQEALRLLNVKAPSTKLATHDSPEVRAALLLEYVAREEKNLRLSMKTIAKALGIKNKAQLETLHRMIGNYRRKDVPLSAMGVDRRATGNSSGPIRQTRNSSAPVESTIPCLAIRLSSLVNDPNGFSRKAQQLFQDILEYVEALPHIRKQDFKLEIQRYRSAYEAACFYHVVAATQTKKLSTRGQSQQRQHQHPTDEDRNHPLELEDILEASPDFSHIVLKQVLKHLGEMVAGIEENRKQNKPKKANNTKRAKDKSTAIESNKQQGKRGSSSKSADRSTKKQKVSRESSETFAETEKSDTGSKISQGDTDKDKDHAFDVDIPSLKEWRKQVLEEACESARIAIHEAKSIPVETVTQSEALAFAADEVLREFGLLA